MVTGGKIKQPWTSVSDLIWDGDLNPEGFAAVVKLPSEPFAIKANGGFFWLAEEDVKKGVTDGDRYLYTGQIGLECKTDTAKCLVGVSVYAYDGMQGMAPLYDAAKGFGNSVVTVTDPVTGETLSTTYATDYTIYELFAQIAFKAGDIPAKIYGQYAMNDDASTEDTGFLAGLKLGSAKEPGQVAFDYNYRSIEKDAVVGAFSDSDFAGGGTNADGHKFKGTLAIARNWQADATVFVNSLDPDGANKDYTRVMVDLVAKF